MIDRYVLFGNPVGQSKSPLIHESFAKATGQSISYGLQQVEIGHFDEAATAFLGSGGRGANVTMPFKLDAFHFATDLSEGARMAGAVNAIKFAGGRALGENFDGAGLVNDIRRNIGFPIEGRRILLLGAGGAARGALLSLVMQKPALLVLANRTASKAIELAERFAGLGKVVVETYDNLGSASFDLVINATSAAMGSEGLPIPPTVFAPGCLAYEMVYGKGITPFLAQARWAGAAAIADGAGMLVEQAAEAFSWWRGIRPPTEGLIRQLSLVPSASN